MADEICVLAYKAGENEKVTKEKLMAILSWEGTLNEVETEDLISHAIQRARYTVCH